MTAVDTSNPNRRMRPRAPFWIGVLAALAVITLAVLAAAWLARDLGSDKRSGGRQP